MQFTAFPGTDLRPSVLCLGTGAFGSAVSVDDSFALLDAFAAAGGNFADAAHIYAAWLPGGAGQSERTLGRWVRSRRPAGFLVGTKGAHPELSTMGVPRLTPECIATDLEESLDRLGLDHVDLYWLHRDDPAMPVDEVMDALHTHVRAGRVRAIGASNWSPERISEANQLAAARGLTQFCASQIGWSFAKSKNQGRGADGTLHMDKATLGWHRSTGFPVVAFSSQAAGYFAHPLPAMGTAPSDKQSALAAAYGTAMNVARHRRATELARRLGHTANDVALAYLWSRPFPAVAIIGSRTPAQLQDSLRPADLTLTAEDLAFLEAP